LDDSQKVKQSWHPNWYIIYRWRAGNKKSESGQINGRSI